MGREIFFAVMGYLSGSILFANLAVRLLNKKSFLQVSKDGNPGTANAFRYGGIGCGMITLTGDLLKGFLPLHIYVQSGGEFTEHPILSSIILAAPVLGHAFPLFCGFQGGKGIAVTFGCLLGVWPITKPLILLVVFFLLFTVALRITPHFQRTIITYVMTCLGVMGLRCEAGIVAGFMMVTAIVCIRLHMSKEERQKMEVGLLWMH